MNQSLKSRLRSGEQTLGSWITLGNAGIAEILAKAGFDWLVVDLEHSTMSIADAGELIRTIDLCGVAPLVRLTSNDPNQVKRVMDCGAHGIVVPMVDTVEQRLFAFLSRLLRSQSFVNGLFTTRFLRHNGIQRV